MTEVSFTHHDWALMLFSKYYVSSYYCDVHIIYRYKILVSVRKIGK